MVPGRLSNLVTHYWFSKDREVSSWPDLLHLYSRLKAGITVYDWMQEHDVHRHGIDPRRFVSFGVIKVGHLFVNIF